MIRRIVLTALFALITPAAAYAACGSLPNTFTNNVSTVDASTTNGNNNFLVTCVKNVDNTQIGAAGIYASQIIPTTTAQATFGGTGGYVIAPSSTSTTSLTLNNPSSTTFDVFDAEINAVKKFYVDSSGNTNVVGTLTGSSTILGTYSGASTASYVAPVVASNGAATANTYHEATFATTGLSASCTQIGVTGYYFCSQNGITMFSGAAVFTGLGTWTCKIGSDNTPIVAAVSPTNGTGGSIQYIANSNTTNPQITAICGGT